MKLRVRIDDQSYDVEVGDLNTRPILATVEGETFEVWPEENGKAPQAAVPAQVFRFRWRRCHRLPRIFRPM